MSPVKKFDSPDNGPFDNGLWLRRHACMYVYTVYLRVSNTWLVLYSMMSLQSQEVHCLAYRLSIWIDVYLKLTLTGFSCEHVWNCLIKMFISTLTNSCVYLNKFKLIIESFQNIVRQPKQSNAVFILKCIKSFFKLAANDENSSKNIKTKFRLRIQFFSNHFSFSFRLYFRNVPFHKWML